MNWEMIGVGVAGLGLMEGLFLWAAKWLLDRSQKQVCERLDNIEAANSKRQDEIQALARDIMKLKVELAKEYVRREDFIRHTAIIDAKLDAIKEALERVREKVYERS